MAVTRLTLNEIRQMVRLLIGEPDQALSRVKDSDTGTTDVATLTKFVNSYSQLLPHRLSLVAQQEGLARGSIYPDFWRTDADLTATSGS